MHDDLAAIDLPQYADFLFGRVAFAFHKLVGTPCDAFKFHVHACYPLDP